MELEFDLVFGLHSVAAALSNPGRQHVKLVASDDGLSELAKKHRLNPKNLGVKVELVSPHQVQETAKVLCQHLNVEFNRVPSQIFLQTSKLETFQLTDFLDKPELRLLALDQITDVHNGAAILRTASFYGINGVLIPSEKSFGLTPSFYRIASGATEYLKLIRVNSLSRAVGQLNEAGFLTVGLSEHAKDLVAEANLKEQRKLCLILGAEEVGISHAVSRLMQKTLSLPSQGSIKSLNVASAAAIAMEKCFGL